MCQGCALPPEGARNAAAAMMSAISDRSAGSAGSVYSPADRRSPRDVAGSSSWSSAVAMSMRTRPDGSVSRRPILRMASATAAAPSATSPANCGHVDSVWPSSTSDAAPRADRLVASMMRRTRNLLPIGKAGEAGDVCIAKQAVQDGPLRLQVEPLDVDQAAVAGCHQNGESTGPRSLANQGFNVQRIAFLDNDVEAVEEFADDMGVTPDVITRTHR